MKGMKKLLCTVLAGAMIVSVCACNKNGSSKSRRDDDDDDRDQREEQTDDDETTETTRDVEVNPEDQYWFVDPTDETTMKRLVDDMFKCEPKLGDVNIVNERSDYADRVWDGFDHRYSSSYGLSAEGEFVFEYGDNDNEEIINRRDHVSVIAYNGYERESLGGIFDFKISSYEESYMHPYRPGSCEAAIYIYDQARAEKCQQILLDYLSEIYKDEIIRTEDAGILGIKLYYGNDGIEYVGYVRLIQCRDEDKNPIDTWFVDVCVTFNTPELMRADVVAESERAATETTAADSGMTETSLDDKHRDELDESNDPEDDDDWYDDDDDWYNDDDWEDEEDDDFWDFDF